MTAPSDPEASPEPLAEEQEIILRLGDILPRVPANLLMPGPHDGSAQIRFSVEELAEKISRGRVSVPLERLSSVCPKVFRDRSAFPGEPEVPLPLQKLLEQVGLVVPKAAAPNGIPGDQVAQARAEAGRIIETKTPAPPKSPAPPAATPTVSQSASEPAPAAPSSPRISKAISTARHLLGLLGLQNETIVAPASEEKPAGVAAAVIPPEPVQEPPPPPPSSTEPPLSPPPSGGEPPLPPPSSSGEQPSSLVQTAAPDQTPPEPAAQPAAGTVSLHVLPIFRLLSPPVLKSGDLPPRGARVAIPLSIVDPQLPGGHVEIPMEEFYKALPENLRHMIEPMPGTQVWIPLDEIFQNLPTDHLYYMPMFDPLAEPAADVGEAVPLPETKRAVIEQPAAAAVIETPVAVEPPAAVEPPVAEAEPEKAQPAEVLVEKAEPVEARVAPGEIVKEENAPEPEAQEAPVAVDDVAPEAAPAANAPVAEPPVPEKAPEAEPVLNVEPAPAPPESPVPSRAPWMHGFQVPPPRLFAQQIAPTEGPVQPAPVEPPPPVPATPEAKRTVDFLAGQPGIFAAAAFVAGAVFASSDFPRKPDLDALRDFMGAFIEGATESGRRLGWNRVLTIPCEQFHLTAVVRETHFVVALHHDRVLPALTYEALVAAAEDLSKAAA